MNRRLLLRLSLAACSAVVLATESSGTSLADTAPALDLGAPGLPETRTVSTLQPGVTLTRIHRGDVDASLRWVVEVNIKATATSPDPDAPPRSISDQASAQTQADALATAGFPARVEAVRQPQTDVPAGVLGYRVRTGDYPSQAEATQLVADLKARGFSSRAWYTGWDGGTAEGGPWDVNVVTIDPASFTGTFDAAHAPKLFDRATTTQLAQNSGATVATNGGFFVLDPAAGAPGDPAGVAVYDGRFLREPVSGRPALVVRPDARHTDIARLTWRGTADIGGRQTALDGIDRVPGLIRNCGGQVGDQPTASPLHDVTCTAASDLVLFTPDYAATTPAGAGREVVIGPNGQVRRVLAERGTALAPDERSLQAIGDATATLADATVDSHIVVNTALEGPHGERVVPHGSVVNGGPQLLVGGAVAISQARDGMVHPTDPSFAYGWVVQRNPRTFAGVDAQGRTLIVTVDGRQPGELGLSIPEAAAVARSLGMVDAINLDGGGSTAMAVNGSLISKPSDATGERPIGDALVVRPPGS